MPLMYYKHYKRSVKQSSLFCVFLEPMKLNALKETEYAEQVPGPRPSSVLDDQRSVPDLPQAQAPSST